jgi:adhesin transport system outer membrane protein
MRFPFPNRLLSAALAAFAMASSSLAGEPPAACIADPAPGDAGVDGLVRVAAARHPSVQSRIAERDSAQAGVEAAKMAWWPTPSVSRENVSASSTDPSYAGGNALTLIGLRQPLWNGGRIGALRDRAQAVAESSDIAVREQREAVAIQVITAYGEWLRQYRQFMLTDASIRLHQSLYDQADRRIEAGVSAQIDRQLTQSRLRQLVVDRAKLESARRVALSRLSQLAGRELSEPALVRAAERPLCLQQRDDLIDQMVRRSPALARLRSDLNGLGAEIDAKKAARFPEVYLRVERQYGNYAMADARPQNRVFVGLQYQPGAGFSLASDIEASVRHREASERSLEATRLDLVDQFTAEWEEHQTLRERLAAAQDSLTDTLAVKESYERQYQAGRKSWLDVMNMVREQLQIELQMADLEASILALSRRLRLRASGLAEWGTQ